MRIGAERIEVDQPHDINRKMIPMSIIPGEKERIETSWHTPF